jgi:hypothetical protein
MQVAPTFGLRVIWTFRHRFSDPTKCKTSPILQFKKMAPSNQGNTVVPLITVNICHLPGNFHFCMKPLVINFYGCVSEGINCSLTKQQSVWAQRSSANQLTLKKALQMPLYWEGDAHLVPFWTRAPAVYCRDCKYFVQCHVFAHSPLGRRPSQKYPVTTSHRSRFV